MSYVTLPDASRRFAAKGLTGQTVRVLRAAIARGTLAAVKDGRVWKTTIEKLDEYEARLWRQPRERSVAPQIVPQITHRPTPPRRTIVNVDREAEAAAQLRAMFGTASPSDAQIEALLGRHGKKFAASRKRGPLETSEGLLSSLRVMLSLK